MDCVIDMGNADNSLHGSPQCKMPSTVSTQRVTSNNNIHFRELTADDVPDIKKLCKECFPLKYPDHWFVRIVTEASFITIAATIGGRVVGMLVAEVKCNCQLLNEDRDLLASSFPADTLVVYILSIGVYPNLRRRGIASLLMNQFFETMSSGQLSTKIKAVFLHVLTTNYAAIKFYRERNFKQLHYLPGYYVINGEHKDGFSYAYYLNGGRPPWTYSELFLHVVSALQDLQPCRIPQKFFHQLHTFLQRCFPRPNYPPVFNRIKNCHNM